MYTKYIPLSSNVKLICKTPSSWDISCFLIQSKLVVLNILQIPRPFSLIPLYDIIYSIFSLTSPVDKATSLVPCFSISSVQGHSSSSTHSEMLCDLFSLPVWDLLFCNLLLGLCGFSFKFLSQQLFIPFALLSSVDICTKWDS